MTTKVLGYIKPLESFKHLSEFDLFVHAMLAFQDRGMDTRNNQLPYEIEELVKEYFGFLLDVEADRYDLLTRKNVLDFVEDFVNHRYWNFEKQFSHFFPDVMKLKFSHFYSRGDVEPYVLLNDEYTEQLYGSVHNPKLLQHYTTAAGLQRLIDSLGSGQEFDISCFTVMERPFFRSDSKVLVQLIGNVRAGFRSDIKSVAVSSGRRACNMHRLEYPGRDLNNICYDLSECDGDVRTSIWNEYIATPIQIVSVEVRKDS
jgi:hypothetical protein